MKQYRKLLQEVLTVLLGNCLYALGVVLFVSPAGLITGGTTGLGIFAGHYFHIPLSAFVLGLNVVMFILGWFVLGRKFAFTTIISTFAYPAFLGICTRLLGGIHLTENPMLNVIFGGAMIGLAIGFVIRAGSSTGGMDIPTIILNKHFKIPVSVSLYAFDFVIILLQATFCDTETILYGILLVAVYTIVLDKVILIGQSRIQLQIISRHAEAIRTAIIEEIDRGVTFLHGRTGYLEKETEVLLSVISPRELGKTEKLVHRIDPEAFVIVDRVFEVRGKGFSDNKKYIIK